MKFKSSRNLKLENFFYDEDIYILKSKNKTKKDIDDILENRKKEKEKTRNKRKNILNNNYFYEKDIDIKTKFVLEKLQNEMLKEDFDINKASYFLSILSEKKDLKNFKEEINFLVFELKNLFEKNENEILRSEVLNFLMFLNKIEKWILEKNIYKNFLNIVFFKTRNLVSLSNFDYLLDFIKENNIDISDTNFIEFFLNDIFNYPWFKYEEFINTSEFLLKNNKTRNIFLKNFLEKYEKNKDSNTKKTFFTIVELLKDFENFHIEKEILEKIQDSILEVNLIYDEKISTFETLKIFHGFSMMNEKWIKKEIIDFCFENIINNEKDIVDTDISRIIIWLQNFPENYIKDKYIDFLNNYIEKNINNFSIFTARTILYYAKNLSKKLDENVTNLLFGKVEEIFSIENTEKYEFKNKIFNSFDWDLEENDIIFILITQIYHLYDRKIPEELEKIFEEKIENNLNFVTITPFQKIFFETLSEKYEKVLISKYKFWFEMDIFVPELNLNIELDWAQHNLWIKKLKDKIRDNFLRSKWVKVKRIFWRRNMKNFLDEIKNSEN